MESSAEIHFAQRLASNEKKIRDKSINKLRKWFEVRSQHKKGGFTEGDFLKLWKGLHYCMWMQDKMVIQEELADRISQLVHVFKQANLAITFVDTFFQTEAREWDGIDRWRLDKFMMLVRCMLHQTLLYLKKSKWRKSLVTEFVDVLSQRVMDPDVTDGLKIHVTDIYIDELEKVGAELLTADQVIHFLEPFTRFIQKSTNTVLVNRVISRIFDAIVEQSVGDAMEAAEKQLEAEGDQEDEKDTEEMEEPEDIDIDMPPRLEFDFNKIADCLFEIGKDEKCLSRNRALIYACVRKFRDLEQGILPNSDDKTEGFDPKKGYISRGEFDRAVRQLEAIETVNKKKRKKKKKKKDPNCQIEGEQRKDEADEDNNDDDYDNKDAKSEGITKTNVDNVSVKESKIGLDSIALKHEHDLEDTEKLSKNVKKQKRKSKGKDQSSGKNMSESSGNASKHLSEDVSEHHVHFTDVDESYSYEPIESFDEDGGTTPKKRRKSKNTVDSISVNTKAHKVGLDDVALKHSHDDDDNKICSMFGISENESRTLSKNKKGSSPVKGDEHHVHFSSLKPEQHEYVQENDETVRPPEKKAKKNKSRKSLSSGGDAVEDGGNDHKVGLDDVELKHLHDHDHGEADKSGDEGAKRKSIESSKNSKQHVHWEQRTVKHIYESENENLKQANEGNGEKELIERKEDRKEEGDLVKRNSRKRKSSDGKAVINSAESSHHVGFDVVALKHLHDNEAKQQEKGKSVKAAKRKSGRKESMSSSDSINGTENRNEKNGNEETTPQDQDSKSADTEIGDEEIEIWVPNKKYKGKLAAQIEEQIKKVADDMKPKRSPKTRAEKAASKNFAHFDDLKKSPPAFVRKAVSKATPKTPKGKSVNQQTPVTPASGDKKKVVFNMKNNQARDFKDSIKFSPQPFNPLNTPDHGILKTPEAIQTPRTKASSAKKLRSSTKKRK